MVMSTQGVWTLDALDRLPDDGNRYEVLDGELYVTPAPSPAHELLANELRTLLEPYVRQHGLGRVFVPRAVLRVSGSEVEPDVYCRNAMVSRPTGGIDRTAPPGERSTVASTAIHS